MNQQEFLGFDLLERWDEVFQGWLTVIADEVSVDGNLCEDGPRSIGRVDFTAKSGKIIYVIESKLGGAFSIFDAGEALIYRAAYLIDRRIYGSGQNVKALIMFPLEYLTPRIKYVLIFAKVEWIAISVTKN